ALNYWYGMSTGVIDVVLSDQLSYYTRKMVQLFRKSIISGSLNPFEGELRSQDGLIQDAKAGKLPNEKIIEMNWLNDNIRGSIPDPDELDERAERVMEISGIRKKDHEDSGSSR
ncbi:MAG: BMP family ABC transporter substrate-binding protein, partial [Bulleidia sp.]